MGYSWDDYGIHPRKNSSWGEITFQARNWDFSKSGKKPYTEVPSVRVENKALKSLQIPRSCEWKLFHQRHLQGFQGLHWFPAPLKRRENGSAINFWVVLAARMELFWDFQHEKMESIVGLRSFIDEDSGIGSCKNLRNLIQSLGQRPWTIPTQPMNN